MSIEEFATLAVQVSLILVWTGVLLFTSLSYLKDGQRRVESEIGSMTTREVGTYALFMFGFLPALFVCLPMIAILPLDDIFCAPAVMAWLVILFSGFLGFHIGLVPKKEEWRKMLLHERRPTSVDMVSSDKDGDLRRNV